MLWDYALTLVLLLQKNRTQLADERILFSPHNSWRQPRAIWLLIIQHPKSIQTSQKREEVKNNSTLRRRVECIHGKYLPGPEPSCWTSHVLKSARQRHQSSINTHKGTKSNLNPEPWTLNKQPWQSRPLPSHPMQRSAWSLPIWDIWGSSVVLWHRRKPMYLSPWRWK